MTPIVADLLKMMERMIRYPEATICRHSVACDIVQILETNGIAPPEQLEELAKNLVDGSPADYDSLQSLQGLRAFLQGNHQ